MADAQAQPKAKTQKPFVKCQFNGSDDPAATDPVYFSHNGKRFYVPREQEFVIEYDAISHLMVSEERIVSKQNPVTGEYHRLKQKVSFNKPTINEWLSEEQARPLLEAQFKAQTKDQARIAAEEAEIAQH